MISIIATDKGGAKREVRISRGELIRRAMATQTAQMVLNLVANHHVNEQGRSITLDHQWMRIYGDPSTDMRIIAGAQKGKTLYQMVKTFAQLILGMSVGWVMPKEGKIHELVKGKMNPTINNTPLYSELQRASGGDDTMKFKTFGQYGKLYLVTANSETELTSFSADAMHIDERDFCNRSNLPMYTSRMNFSPYKLTDEISTPTIDGTMSRIGQRGTDNIHSEFLNGDQFRYHSRCPHCDKRQILDWYENIVKVRTDESGRITGFDVLDQDWSPGSPSDLRVCCVGCGRPFDRTVPGDWVALNPGAKRRTYWIESLATPVGPSMADLLETFTKALGNPSKMQQFHNMDLGRTYAGGMLRFGRELFEKCERSGHYMLQESAGPCTMGIDVNRPWLDIQISRWEDGKQIKVYVGKEEGDENMLLSLAKRFNVRGVVMDNEPETKFTLKCQELFADNRIALVRCRYATGEQSREIVVSEKGKRKIDPPRLISVDRTIAIDTLYESMQTRAVEWFENWYGALDGALFGEFHNPVRMLVVNDKGNERFAWAGKPDHQLQAAVYDQLAGRVLGFDINRDFTDVLPAVSSLQHTITQSPNPANQSQRPKTSGDDVVIFMG